MKIKLPKSMKSAFGAMLAVGIVAVVGILIFRLIQKNAGFFSYAGLSPEEIDMTAKEMDSRCKILSRVYKPENDRYRGIYLGGDCMFPLYYHYTPGKEFEIYPLLWNELWTSNKDLLNLTGKMVYPTAKKES